MIKIIIGFSSSTSQCPQSWEIMWSLIKSQVFQDALFPSPVTNQPVYLWNVPHRCSWCIPQHSQSFDGPEPTCVKRVAAVQISVSRDFKQYTYFWDIFGFRGPGRKPWSPDSRCSRVFHFPCQVSAEDRLKNEGIPHSRYLCRALHR